MTMDQNPQAQINCRTCSSLIDTDASRRQDHVLVLPTTGIMSRVSAMLFALLLGVCTVGQEVQLVRDSIMDAYMKSGRANGLFTPTGKSDKNKLRQGKWKDYKVEHDFVMVAAKDYPKRITAHYLIYGEGQYLDGKREGLWHCYTIVDKTFKHLPYKEVTYVNGVEQGPVTYSYPDGRKGFEGTYVNGELEGGAEMFYENGSVHTSFFHLRGAIEGEMTGYRSDGQLKFIKHYVNDTLEGSYIRYYPDGQVEEKLTYAAGVIDGPYHYYHQNGQLWVEWLYDKGKPMNVTGSYDAQGARRDPGTLKDGNGTLLQYDDSGKVYLVKTFKDGVEIGKEKR